MVTPNFYNSLTRRVERLATIQPGSVKIYHCGPTVYKRPHLGNMRRFLFADFLGRTLKYLGYSVFQVINITDVGHLTQDDIDEGQDKLELEAGRQKKTPQEIAQVVTAQYMVDREALNIEPADVNPRATDHIKEMQAIISKLLASGKAYQTTSGVYFDVQAFPKYGVLSGNTLVNMAAGKRVKVRAEKKHPADFALWKTDDKSHLQQWDSPWGRGYPGWHIECSAMSMKYLGETLDIHTGGEDNRFPHHENEIAQSEATTGKPLANLWLHNGFLKMGENKLAKREGEQLTVDSIVKHNFSPLAFRLLVFGSHYRQPLNFTWEGMAAAQENLNSFTQLMRQLDEHGATLNAKPDEKIIKGFTEALADDLNTPAALAILYEYRHKVNEQLLALDKNAASEVLATLLMMDRVLGILGLLHKSAVSASVPASIQDLVNQREVARSREDFAEADRLRVLIESHNYIVEDTPSGPRVISS